MSICEVTDMETNGPTFDIKRVDLQIDFDCRKNNYTLEIRMRDNTC